jgi:DNA-binding NarL/FixJ family response regulator
MAKDACPAAGLSNAEIAAALVLSNATDKTHVNHIFAKTGAGDRAQAVRYAYQHRISRPQPGRTRVTIRPPP